MFDPLSEENARLLNELSFERQLTECLDNIRNNALFLIQNCKCDPNEQFIKNIIHLNDNYEDLVSGNRQRDNCHVVCVRSGDNCPQNLDKRFEIIGKIWAQRAALWGQYGTGSSSVSTENNTSDTYDSTSDNVKDEVEVVAQEVSDTAAYDIHTNNTKEVDKSSDNRCGEQVVSEESTNVSKAVHLDLNSMTDTSDVESIDGGNRDVIQNEIKTYVAPEVGDLNSDSHENDCQLVMVSGVPKPLDIIKSEDNYEIDDTINESANTTGIEANGQVVDSEVPPLDVIKTEDTIQTTAAAHVEDLNSNSIENTNSCGIEDNRQVLGSDALPLLDVIKTEVIENVANNAESITGTTLPPLTTTIEAVPQDVNSEDENEMRDTVDDNANDTQNVGQVVTESNAMTLDVIKSRDESHEPVVESRAETTGATDVLSEPKGATKPKPKKKRNRHPITYYCNECVITFDTEFRLRTHLADIHNNPVFECKHCDYRGRSPKVIKRHMQRQHPELIPKSKKKRKYADSSDEDMPETTSITSPPEPVLDLPLEQLEGNGSENITETTTKTTDVGVTDPVVSGQQLSQKSSTPAVAIRKSKRLSSRNTESVTQTNSDGTGGDGAPEPVQSEQHRDLKVVTHKKSKKKVQTIAMDPHFRCNKCNKKFKQLFDIDEHMKNVHKCTVDGCALDTSADENTVHNTSADKISVHNTSADKISVHNTSADQSIADNTAAVESCVDSTNADESTVNTTSAGDTTIDNTSAGESAVRKTVTKYVCQVCERVYKSEYKLWAHKQRRHRKQNLKKKTKKLPKIADNRDTQQITETQDLSISLRENYDKLVQNSQNTTENSNKLAKKLRKTSGNNEKLSTKSDTIPQTRANMSSNIPHSQYPLRPNLRSTPASTSPAPGAKYKCSYKDCGQLFANEPLLKKHKSRVHTVNARWGCDKCDYRHHRSNQVRRHMYNVHGLTKYRENVVKRLFKCQSCGNHHLLVSDDNQTNRYDCQKCKHNYNCVDELVAHMSRKHCKYPKASTDNEKSVKNGFKCHILGCNAVLKSRGNLAEHLRIRHSTQKPFKCDLCEFRCKRKPCLEAHRSSHSKERLIKCDYEGCDIRVKNATRLSEHRLRVHKFPGLMYPCDWPGCGGKFTTKSYAKYHKDMVHRVDVI